MYEHVWSPLSARQGEALRVVSVRGGRSDQITPYAIAAGDSPDWSPGGRWLIFRTDADQEGGPSRLFMVHPDGSGLKDFETPGDTVLSSSFSPDGDWIVLASPSRGGAFDLYVMKEQPGLEIVVTGSITLCHTLIEAGLVDEYRLFVYPVVQGRGRRLFPDGFQCPELRLLEVKAFRSGITYSRYTHS